MARRSNQRRRGLIRDKHGVVLAFAGRHRMLDVFTAIPLAAPELPDGGDLPPINLPSEMKQQLCLHIFENLYPGLPAPLPPGVRAHLVDDDGQPILTDQGAPAIIEGSRYRLVNPTGDRGLPMGGAGEHWLTWKIDAQTVKREAAELMADVGQAIPMPDVANMTDAEADAYAEQLRLQQIRLEKRAVASEQAQQLDVPIDTNRVRPPEFGNWRENNRSKLRPKGDK